MANKKKYTPAQKRAYYQDKTANMPNRKGGNK